MTATASAPGREWALAPDGALLDEVRAGHWDAYAELWRRHLPSAYAVASRYRGRGSVEDIVGEASLRIYDRIRAGKGPTTNFRSYFLTTVKSVAVDFRRAELRVVPTEPDQLEVAADTVPAVDPAVRVDQDLVRVAFHRLSAREQEVLWRVVVEGWAPSTVSASLGLSANGVSAAASRARQSLRDSYLDAHSDRAVERANSPECRWVLARMGKYVRGKMRAGQRTRIERHLRECRHARVLVTELNDINRGLPALLVPLAFVGGVSSPTLWASGLAASLASTTGHQPPAVDTSSLATVATAGTTSATGAMVAKTAAVVAAGAFGAGLATPTPGPGIWSNDRVQVHATAGSAWGSLRVNEPDSRTPSAGDRLLTPSESAGAGWRLLEPFISMPGSVDASFALRIDEVGMPLVTDSLLDGAPGGSASLQADVGADGGSSPSSDATTATSRASTPTTTTTTTATTTTPTTVAGTPPLSGSPAVGTETSNEGTPVTTGDSSGAHTGASGTADTTTGDATTTPAVASDGGTTTTPTPTPASDGAATTAPTATTAVPTGDSPAGAVVSPTATASGASSSTGTTGVSVTTTPTPSSEHSAPTTTSSTKASSSSTGTATTGATSLPTGTVADATSTAGATKDAATVTPAQTPATVSASPTGTATTTGSA
ncbi:MAG: sigma-70 family RNA polymerase sigma factor [Dermatophilaceae bacterium]